MRNALLIFVFFWAGFGANAQPAGEVRAGEHEGFSRLVVYLEPSAEWGLTKNEQGYVFEVENWNAGFDVSGVFGRIPRNRIVDLTAYGGWLEIQINCECPVRSQRFGERAVVIDVVDTAPTIATPGGRKRIAPPDNANSDNEPGAIVRVLEQQEPKPQSQDLGELRASVTDGIFRSASSSLLQFVESSASPRILTNSGLGGLAGESPERARIATAIELASGGSAAHAVEPELGNCSHSEHYDLISWGTEEDFSAQIGKRRRATITELDRPDRSGILGLVRAYLFFGMAAEARAVLEAFSLSGPDVGAALTLADVMEPTSSEGSEWLALPIGCHDHTVPWRILLKEPGAVVARSDVEAVLAEVSKWPEHLKTLLGRKLDSRLRDGGQEDAADVLRSVLARGNEPLLKEFALTSESNKSSSDEEIDTLLSTVETGGDHAPEALNLYLTKAMSKGMPISDDLLTLAAAFEAELEGLPSSDALRSTRIEALAYDGQVLGALSLLQERAPANWVAGSDLLEELGKHASQSGNVEFAVRYSLFLLDNGRIGELNAGTTESIARNLLAAGIPKLSIDLYHAVPKDKRNLMFYAKAQSADGNDAAAIEALQGVLDPAAHSQRLGYILAQGKAAAAWRGVEESTSTEIVSEIAWAAGQWSSVTAGDERDVIAELLAEPPDVINSNNLLVGAIEINSKARESTIALQNLLVSLEYK